MIEQIATKSRNPINKALTVKTVSNSKVRRTNMFKERIVTQMADRLGHYAKTHTMITRRE